MNYTAMMHRIAQVHGGSSAPVGSENTNPVTGLSRRRFFKLTGVSGLALGAAPLSMIAPVVAGAQEENVEAELKPDQQPDAFVRIGTDGTVTIQINRLEFGQGTHTGLAMILAEELDADWSRVRAELAPAGEAYKDPVFGIQMTGGSSAIINGYTPYRELGARARAMLVTAAASIWDVPVSEVSAADGVLTGPGGRSASFGAMSQAASLVPVPQSVTLKTVDQFKLIGQATTRLDTEAKSTGSQSFGIDVSLPGMKTVLIARPPMFGGRVERFDASAAEQIKGVEKAFEVELDRNATGVAIVADGFWPAKHGRDALSVDWAEPAEKADTAALQAQFKALLEEPGLPARQADTSGLQKADRTITADYSFPFLAHAPMEPLNAVIQLSGAGEQAACTVWSGTQFQTIDQGTIAAVLGLRPEQVIIKTQFAGGGFGRRATPTADYLADAARVMKAWRAQGGADIPLRVMWSREDDIRGGYYRPMTMHRARIGLDDTGQVTAWAHKIVSPSILTGTAFESFLVKDGVDHTTTEGVGDTAYDLPIDLGVHHPKLPVPTLWWRAVGHTHTAFVMETLIDEIARETESDPVDLRRRLLSKHPRHLAALDLAVEKSGYGRKELPAGHAWGVAVHESFKSVVAYVVQASVEQGRPKIHHVTGAIHCNLAVNPKSVITQVQGAALMGIGTTLAGEKITLKDGVVEQSNFHDYQVARITDMPVIDVHIVPSADPPTGVGEPGLPPMAPAIANAMAAITGKPIRELPIRLT